MRKWYPALLVGVMFGVSAAMYPRLPERIPTHWNLRGEIDGYGSRAILFVMPFIALAIWGLLRVLPMIDPRRASYDKMWRAYDAVVNASVTVIAAVHVMMIASATGAHISVERIMPAFIGLMLVVVGNVLPQARPNWFFGIRTPWTLSNDRVWERTHRVGGYLLVVAGVVAIISVALPFFIGFAVMFTAAAIAALGSIVYSYVVWKQETRQELSK